LAKIFLTQLAIKSLFKFTPNPTSASALHGEGRPSIIRVEVNEKTSINVLYPNLWGPEASLLQSLTVIQQCFYQMTFRNVFEVKKRLVQPRLVWSRYRYCCQWMEKVSSCLCSHNGLTFQAILLQTVEKWITG